LHGNEGEKHCAKTAKASKEDVVTPQAICLQAKTNIVVFANDRLVFTSLDR